MTRPVSAGAHRRSLALLFAATFVELTAIFVFGPLLLFQLQARGLGAVTSASVVGGASVLSGRDKSSVLAQYDALAKLKPAVAGCVTFT